MQLSRSIKLSYQWKPSVDPWKQSAVNYQKERAAEVEEAQKALIEDRQFHKKDELGLNFNSEA